MPIYYASNQLGKMYLGSIPLGNIYDSNVLVNQGYTSNVLNTNLKLWNTAQLSGSYSGSVWYDLSGNNNTGSITAAFFTGSNPTWLEFDNPPGFEDSYVDYGDILDANSALTVQTWIMTYSTGASDDVHIVGDWWDGDPTRSSWRLQHDGSNLIFQTARSGSSTLDVTFDGLQLNTWYNIVGTYDGDNQKLYLNGTLVSSGSYGSTLALNNSTTALLLGKDNNDHFFNGRIGEWEFYDRALDQSEISYNYNVTRPYYNL